MKLWKKALGVSAIAATLFLSGCGDTNSEVETQLQAQQLLDNAQYAQAAALLESKVNKTDSDYMMLSSAYMGMAGFSFSDILVLMAQSNSDSSTQSSSALYRASSNGGDDTFLNFLTEIEQKADANDNIIELLDKAKSMLDNLSVKTDSAKLNEGLALSMKGSVALSYMGDVVRLAQNSQSNDPEAQNIRDDFVAYGCAIAKIYAPNARQPRKCSNVDATQLVQKNGTTYTLLKVTLNTTGDVFFKLANANKDQVLLTNSICNTQNEEGCVLADDNATRIPKLAGNGNITIENALLDTINAGFDLLVDIAPDDTKDDVRAYKDEIDDNADGVISADELAAWIDDQSDD